MSKMRTGFLSTTTRSIGRSLGRIGFLAILSAGLILGGPKSSAEEDGMGRVDVSDPGISAPLSTGKAETTTTSDDTVETLPVRTRHHMNSPMIETSEASPPPVVGRKAAQKYMAHRIPASSVTPVAAKATRSESSDSSANHYLAVHIGTFVSDDAYSWGSPSHQTNVGKFNLGVTYRVGEWVNAADLNVRVDLSSYQLDEGRATKLSFLPVIIFPDASSRFPLYFGAGAGLGVFLNQIPGKSPLSLDYQVFLGARFFDLFENTGFFIESGLKNHFLLTSSGQYNGVFVAVGAVFTF
jgi:cytoskeletal protein RodZ